MKRNCKNYHWIIMVSCCLMAAACIGMFTNAYGVYYTPISEAIGIGRGEVAIHATIAGLLTGFLGPVAVKLLKKIKLRALIATGMLCMCISTVLTAYAANLWQLNLLGVIRGVGCACYYIPVLTVILGNWFEKYYGTVMGITFSFSGIAGAVLSPVLSSLTQNYGYRTSLIIAAAVVFVLSCPGLLLCQTRPEEIGMRALGANEKKTQRTSDSELKAESTDLKKKSATRKSVYQTPGFLLLSIVGFLTISISGMSQHLSGYSESIGTGTVIGVSMMSCAMIGNIVFKLLNGILSDLIGAVETVLAAIVITIMGVLMILSGNTTLMLIGAFFFGAVYSVGAVGLATVARELFDRKDYGEAYSVVAALTCVGASLSLTVIGASYDLTGGYQLALWGEIIFGLVSMAGLFMIRSLIGKNMR